MIDNALHRKIAKMLRKKEMELANDDKSVPNAKTGPENSYPDMAITKLTGYEKEYEKQVPVIASGKKPNMEVVKKVPRDKHGQQYGLLVQSQLGNFKGGSEAQPTELDNQAVDMEELQLRRQMGAGKRAYVNDPEQYLAKQKLGGAKTEKRVAEAVEGADVLPPAVVKPKRGRRAVAKERSPSPVKERSLSPVKEQTRPAMKRRADKIKELMKSKQLTMIQASKYINEKKVSY